MSDFRYDLYCFDQASKLLHAAKLVKDTDPDWWEVWNDEPFQEEVRDNLVTVARRVNQAGVSYRRHKRRAVTGDAG